MVKFSTYQKIEQDINYYISSYFPTYKKITTITTRDVLNWQKELNKLELSISTKKKNTYYVLFYNEAWLYIL